jgi:hypothetical protein
MYIKMAAHNRHAVHQGVYFFVQPVTKNIHLQEAQCKCIYTSVLSLCIRVDTVRHVETLSDAV